MTDNEYLEAILYRERVDTAFTSPIRRVQQVIGPLIQTWGGTYLRSVTPSGSFAKGTANKSGTDIDLFISLHSRTSETLKQIYESLQKHLSSSGYKPRPQNVSLNITINNLSVDLVPGKLQNNYSEDHSLYKRKADSWTKTNISEHIRYVSNSGRINEIRALKLWRNQCNLDFPSFYLELTVIEALSRYRFTTGLGSNIVVVLEYLRDSFTNARVVDPANTNNIISDDLSVSGKMLVKAAASSALNSNWKDFIR